MKDLSSIDRRMKSLRMIREVVSSLRALSSLQLRRSQQALQQWRPMEAHLRAAIAAVAAPRPPAVDPTRVLLLAFGSDQGFCGTLVKQVVASAVERVAACDARYTLVGVGYRTAELLAERIGRDVPAIAVTASASSLDPLVDALSTMVERRVTAGDVDGIEAIYARHRATGRYSIERVRLLPVDPSRLPAVGRPTRLQEPADDVLGHLLVDWLYAELYRLVLEAQASEHGARLQTTDAATRSIDDTLEQLRAEHHRARQAQVTAEVQEILAAAELVFHSKSSTRAP